MIMVSFYFTKIEAVRAVGSANVGEAEYVSLFLNKCSGVDHDNQLFFWELKFYILYKICQKLCYNNLKAFSIFLLISSTFMFFLLTYISQKLQKVITFPKMIFR